MTTGIIQPSHKVDCDDMGCSYRLRSCANDELSLGFDHRDRCMRTSSAPTASGRRSLHRPDPGHANVLSVSQPSNSQSRKGRTFGASRELATTLACIKCRTASALPIPRTLVSDAGGSDLTIGVHPPSWLFLAQGRLSANPTMHLGQASVLYRRRGDSKNYMSRYQQPPASAAAPRIAS